MSHMTVGTEVFLKSGNRERELNAKGVPPLGENTCCIAALFGENFYKLVNDELMKRL